MNNFEKFCEDVYNRAYFREENGQDFWEYVKNYLIGTDYNPKYMDKDDKSYGYIQKNAEEIIIQLQNPAMYQHYLEGRTLEQFRDDFITCMNAFYETDYGRRYVSLKNTFLAILDDYCQQITKESVERPFSL